MLNNIFDTHSHYTDHAFDNDRQELLSSIREKGVSNIMLASSDIEDSYSAIELAEKYEYVYCSVGIHPENADNVPQDYLDILHNMADNNNVKAIGEIGLDYHYEGYNKNAQIKLFEEQLGLAKELGLPVIIHSRDATPDCMQLLKKYRPNGVMHCFSGSAETAREILGLGMLISFTGVITFKNAKKALSALEVIPMDRLMLETDCPYMAPEPFRGSRCDSSMIKYMAEKVAEQKHIPAQEVLNITHENACELFNIQHN